MPTNPPGHVSRDERADIEMKKLPEFELQLVEFGLEKYFFQIEKSCSGIQAPDKASSRDGAG